MSWEAILGMLRCVTSTLTSWLPRTRHCEAGAAEAPSTLGSSLIQVTIVPMSMNATTFDPLVKKLPQNIKISTLKMLVEKKFGVPVGGQLLSFRPDSKVMSVSVLDACGQGLTCLLCVSVEHAQSTGR